MLVDDSELRFKLDQIFLVLVGRVSALIRLNVGAELLMHELMPEGLVLRFAELVDLFVAAFHPVGNVEHVSLYD